MLKLQYFGHLMWRADSLEKTLMLGKTEGRKRRGQQRMRWLDSINGQEFEQTLGDCEGQGGLACCSAWCHRRNWTTTTFTRKYEIQTIKFFWSRKSMGKKGYKYIYKCLNYFLNMYTFHRQILMVGFIYIFKETWNKKKKFRIA